MANILMACEISEETYLYIFEPIIHEDISNYIQCI